MGKVNICVADFFTSEQLSYEKKRVERRIYVPRMFLSPCVYLLYCLSHVIQTLYAYVNMLIGGGHGGMVLCACPSWSKNVA